MLAFALALLLAAPAVLAQPAPARDRLDGIVAVVNDEIVLESDLDEQLYLFLLRSQVEPDSATIDTLRAQILEQLIDEKLIVAEAKRQGLTVSDADVNRQADEALEEVRERLGSAEAFAAQLRRENLTEDKLRDQYRTEVRRQLLAQRLVQKQIPRRQPTAAEAEAYFKANRDRFPKAPAEIRLAVIQIPVEPDSATLAAARAEAAAARRRILAGERFAKVASEVSDDQGSARSGGDLGYFRRGAMDPAFEAAALRQPVGVLGEPVRTPYGWHIIEVVDRDTLRTRAGRDSTDRAGEPIVDVHARHILIHTELSEADVERARRHAEAVRNEALAGADFAALVDRHSRYQGPQREGGDLGFLPLSTLQPQIRAGVAALPVGAISEVLVNQGGFNLFRIVDRKPERPYELAEIRDELPEVVGQMQFRERYSKWVQSLRAKAHVEIRRS